MKAIIQVGYTDYVMDADVALKMMEMLNTAERYRRKGYGDDAAYYIWEQPVTEQQSLTLISEDLYRMAKLAGEPPKD